MYRFLIVFVCYALSALGIYFTIQISIEELRDLKWTGSGIMVWWACWGLHLYMSVAWALRRVVSPVVARVSLLLFVFLLMIIPLQGLLSPSDMGLSSAYTVAFILVLEVLFVLPVLLLGLYLVFLFGFGGRRRDCSVG